MTSTPESDEMAGHVWRLAQAIRLRRFCQSIGVQLEDVMSGKVDPSLLDPICGPDGMIEPEAVDLQHAARGE